MVIFRGRIQGISFYLCQCMLSFVQLLNFGGWNVNLWLWLLSITNIIVRTMKYNMSFFYSKRLVLNGSKHTCKLLKVFMGFLGVIILCSHNILHKFLQNLLLVLFTVIPVCLCCSWLHQFFKLFKAASIIKNCFRSEEEREDAIQKINGHVWKCGPLSAKVHVWALCLICTCILWVWTFCGAKFGDHKSYKIQFTWRTNYLYGIIRMDIVYISGSFFFTFNLVKIIHINTHNHNATITQQLITTANFSYH